MANVLLSAKDIQIRFGGVIAADGIDLDVLEGENLAIIGPNGAGKTTFLNISTGYLRPQAGTVTFLGHDITAQLPRTITKLGIARAFQIPQLFLDQTVMENMLIAAASRKRPPVGPAGALAACRKRRRWNACSISWASSRTRKRTARELPEGQRKLVDIALALALKPKLLLMDEPTSGVASSEKLAIMDILTTALAEGEGHLGLRRARHGHGGALRQPRRRVERGQDPESRHAGGGAGRPEGARAGDRHMTPMLSFENVNVAIADAPVLRNVSFSLQPGVSAALIGRNGAGKTTTVRTIMGFTKSNGTVRLDGEDLGPVAPHRRPALGLGYAPEDRRLFSAFTVEENILLPGRVAKLNPEETRRRLERAYSVLPELKELARRPAGSVSGGQGKMVALGRALMLGTRLLILDEPFQGLAPVLAQRYAGSAPSAAVAGQGHHAADHRIEPETARDVCRRDADDRTRRDRKPRRQLMK